MAPGLEIDLALFRVGKSTLGQTIHDGDCFAAPLQSQDDAKDEKMGIEIGKKEGVLDYVFLTLPDFGGKLLKQGTPLEISQGNSEADIQGIFGEPYWTDRSDGEVIMFYEYERGTVELQFEFPDAQKLGHILLARNGVLSGEEQRKAYKVDKPWPPQ